VDVRRRRANLVGHAAGRGLKKDARGRRRGTRGLGTINSAAGTLGWVAGWAKILGVGDDHPVFIKNGLGIVPRKGRGGGG